MLYAGASAEITKDPLSGHQVAPAAFDACENSATNVDLGLAFLVSSSKF
jgi:hypothetical protein